MRSQKKKEPSKFETLRKRTNQGVLAEHRLKIKSMGNGVGDGDGVDGGSDDDDLFVKKANPLHETLDDLPDNPAPETLSKKKKKSKLTVTSKMKEEGGKSSHLKFGTDGVGIDERTRLVGLDMANKEIAETALSLGNDIVDDAAATIKEADVQDKEVQRTKRREKKLKKKIKRKQDEAGLNNDGDDGNGGGGVTLGNYSDDEGGFEIDSSGFEGPGNFDETFSKKQKKRRTVADDEDLALQLLSGGL